MLPKNIKQHHCLVIIFILVQLSLQQHIFDETCEFRVKLTNKTEVLRFASQDFHITNSYYDVYINFCNKLQKTPDNCEAKSQVCILKKSNKNTKKRRMLKKPVSLFKANFKVDNETKVETVFLNATNIGDDCQFTVTIDKLGSEYQIGEADFDDCAMDVKIPHPDTLLRDCAVSYQGLIIDLRPLRSLPEQFIKVNGTKIALAACRPAESCGTTSLSGICEISPGGYVFSVAGTQHIGYDDRSNLVTIRSKTAGRKKSEIAVKCNWNANFENARKELAKYKYTVESRFGCVKTPLNCQIVDIEEYEYDLSSLNKPAGWIVKNTTNTNTIKINVCGTLQTPPNTKCSEIYSQVCSQQDGGRAARGGHFVSYGALHTGLRMSGDDITLTYTDGSQCPILNFTDKSYSTRITFRCFPTEEGPLMTANINCTANILWKTPAACARQLSADASFSYARIMKELKRTDDLSCSVYHNGQMFRLGSLRTNGMTFDSRVQPNLKYYVNICRPIAINAGNYYCGVTGACIEDGNEINVKKRFKWFGTLKTEPKFENDALVIRYDGGYCQNSTQREIVINFNCTNRQEPLKLSTETTCRTDFIWNTPLACKRKTQRSLNCKIPTQNGMLLDLEELDVKVRNFQLNHDKITYDVDLCSDIINTSTNSSKSDNGSINTTRELLEKDCHYSLIYTLPNSEKETKTCSNDSLTRIRVDLLCNEIENNADHLVDYTMNGCEVIMSSKSAHMCDVKLCEQKPNQMQSQEIKEENKHVYTVQIVQTTNESKPMYSKVCKAINDQHEFIINTLNISSMSNEKDVYVIDVNNKRCSGFICKNNQTLATMELCPNVQVVENDQKVEINLIGPVCNNGFYAVKLVLHCEHDLHAHGVVVSHEDECSTEFHIETNQTCVLFAQRNVLSKKTQGINDTVYVIGIVACLVIILISAVIIWKFKLCNKKCSCCNEGGTSCNSPTRTGLLYFKDGTD